jgi:hypothetical protein
MFCALFFMMLLVVGVGFILGGVLRAIASRYGRGRDSYLIPPAVTLAVGVIIWFVGPFVYAFLGARLVVLLYARLVARLPQPSEQDTVAFLGGILFFLPVGVVLGWQTGLERLVSRAKPNPFKAGDTNPFPDAEPERPAAEEGVELSNEDEPPTDSRPL